jgi:hypothetical protein
MDVLLKYVGEKHDSRKPVQKDKKGKTSVTSVTVPSFLHTIDNSRIYMYTSQRTYAPFTHKYPMKELISVTFQIAGICTVTMLCLYASIMLTNFFSPGFIFRICEKRKPTVFFRFMQAVALIAFCFTFFAVSAGVFHLAVIDTESLDDLKELLFSERLFFSMIIAPIGSFASLMCVLFANNGINGRYVQNSRF